MCGWGVWNVDAIWTGGGCSGNGSRVWTSTDVVLHNLGRVAPRDAASHIRWYNETGSCQYGNAQSENDKEWNTLRRSSNSRLKMLLRFSGEFEAV